MENEKGMQYIPWNQSLRGEKIIEKSFLDPLSKLNATILNLYPTTKITHMLICQSLRRKGLPCWLDEKMSKYMKSVIK